MFLLILVVVLGSVVSLIPMAALVAVMILVSVNTFDWHSIAPATLRRMPKSEIPVMVVTVAVVVATDHLSYGVVVGPVTAMVLFARRVAHLVDVERVVDPDGTQSSTASPARSSSPPSTTWSSSSWSTTTPTASPSTCRPPHLGRLLGRGVRRHREQVRPPRQDRHHLGLNEHSAHMHGWLAGELSGSR